MENLKAYQEFCKTIAQEFEHPDHEIFTWGLGIAGEAGDVAGCIKKTVSHKNDQTEGIRENIGDTLWYAAMICTYYGWDMAEILKENVEKLSKRYPKGFSFEGAKRDGTRVDWNEQL